MLQEDKKTATITQIRYTEGVYKVACSVGRCCILSLKAEGGSCRTSYSQK